MKFIIITLCFLSFSTLTFSRDGSSGCGPAWYALKDNSLLSSALRGTTNAILGVTVTLGMTFGTSNCTKHSIVKREKESLKFATENYFEIAADATRGSGDYITAFATTMGCRPEVHEKFRNKVKESFNKTFNLDKHDPKELIINTYKVMLNEKELVKSCILS